MYKVWIYSPRLYAALSDTKLAGLYLHVDMWTCGGDKKAGVTTSPLFSAINQEKSLVQIPIQTDLVRQTRWPLSKEVDSFAKRSKRRLLLLLLSQPDPSVSSKISLDSLRLPPFLIVSKILLFLSQVWFAH